MNYRSLFAMTLLLLALSNISFPNWACAWQSSNSTNYALLVAVNHYEDEFLNQPPLMYPEADAFALREELIKSGYDVEMLIGKHASQVAIRAKLAGLNTKGNAEGAVILGFFGHGVEYASNKESMYIPYDSVRRLAKADDDSNTERTESDPKSLVGMSEILDAMRLCKAGNTLLLADCCPMNPNATLGTRAFGSSVRLTDLPNHAAAIFACSEGEDAQEDDAWKHGAMTKCFLDLMPEMSNGEADVGAIADKLRKQVAALVAKSSIGSKRQTIHPIVNGIVKLHLLPNKSSIPGEMEGSKAGKFRQYNSLGMKLVWIPEGKFTMGSPEGKVSPKEYATEVEVHLTSGYWLSQTEVTQGQWKQLFATKPWAGEEYVKAGNNYPVTYISWNDCQEFLKQLNDQESSQLPRGWRYDLPTEAQWEYACRAGSETRFSFGEDNSPLDDYAWYEKNGWDVDEKYAHEVEKKRPNAFGLYDMHGNVREWCRDSYADNLRGGTNPFANGYWRGSSRVYRGGSWHDSANLCRSAYRGRDSPDHRNFRLGFRVALVPVVK